jgi:hypothetical protein
MSKESEGDKLRDRGREFYQNLSREIHQNSEKPNNAARRRSLSAEAQRLSNESKAQESKLISNIIRLTNEKGPEAENLILHLADHHIGPRDVPDNIHEIAKFIQLNMHPAKEPVTIRTKTKPLGFLPFGGTESIKTIYDDTTAELPKMTGESIITVERKSFGQRIINKILKRI